MSVRPREDVLRVHITNCVLLNGGDAAIVEATIDSLGGLVSRPIEFTVFDQQADVAARLFPQLRVRPWPWNVFVARRGSRAAKLARAPFGLARAYAGAALIGRGVAPLARLLLRGDEQAFLAEYSRADLVLSKGGTYLVENYRLAPHVFDFRLALLLRRPLVLAPQSLGPFSSRPVRRALRRVLARSTVYVRDEPSRASLVEIGLPAEVIHMAADTAFASADEDALRAARARELPPKPRVAVSVRDWPFFERGYERGMERYRQATAALVTHLVRRYDAHVTFLSTCQGVPEYVTDDSVVARAIAGSLPRGVAERVEVDSGRHDPSALRERIATFDLAVATRLHFAILALGAGVPVLPIAYEFKTTELFRQLGLSDLALHVETIEDAAAIGTLERFLAELPSRRVALFQQVEQQRASAVDAMREIARQLDA